MWTLTYAGTGEHDIAKVRRHIERFLAAVVTSHGERFPYVWVPEYHKSEHGIHIHMAVPFYFDQKELSRLWGRGWVWCSDRKPKGACAFAAAQGAARYLSKYIGKAFEVAEFGRHRYERAQGFEVTRLAARRYDMPDGVEYAERVFQSPPRYMWTSASVDDWTGPRVIVMIFDNEAPDG